MHKWSDLLQCLNGWKKNATGQYCILCHGVCLHSVVNKTLSNNYFYNELLGNWCYILHLSPQTALYSEPRSHNSRQKSTGWQGLPSILYYPITRKNKNEAEDSFSRPLTYQELLIKCQLKRAQEAIGINSEIITQSLQFRIIYQDIPYFT